MEVGAGLGLPQVQVRQSRGLLATAQQVARSRTPIRIKRILEQASLILKHLASP